MDFTLQAPSESPLLEGSSLIASRWLRTDGDKRPRRVVPGALGCSRISARVRADLLMQVPFMRPVTVRRQQCDADVNPWYNVVMATKNTTERRQGHPGACADRTET